MIYRAYCGGKEITDFYIGGKQTSEIYGGSRLLWKKTDDTSESDSYILFTRTSASTSFEPGSSTSTMKLVVPADGTGGRLFAMEREAVLCKSEGYVDTYYVDSIGYQCYAYSITAAYKGKAIAPGGKIICSFENTYFRLKEEERKKTFEMLRDENGIWSINGNYTMINALGAYSYFSNAMAYNDFDEFKAYMES